MAKKITWWQAAEILGITGDRTMRRWKWKYENEGFKGLLDGRKDKIDGSGLKAMLRQRRDNETGIAALFLIFGFRNQAPCAAPTFSRPIVNVFKNAGWIAALFELLPSFLQFHIDHRDQPIIPGEADNIIDAVALAPGQDFIPAKTRVCPDENMDLRPRLPNLLDDSLQFVQCTIGRIAVGAPQARA